MVDVKHRDWIETIEDQIKDLCRRYPDRTKTYEGTYLMWLDQFLGVKLSDHDFKKIVKTSKMGSVHRLRFKVRKEFPLLTRGEMKEQWRDSAREGLI